MGRYRQDRGKEPAAGRARQCFHAVHREGRAAFRVKPILNFHNSHRQPPKALDHPTRSPSWSWPRSCGASLRLEINELPMTSVSILVRKKQSNASSGLQTTGSFSLNEVFNTIGTPVNSRKLVIRRW
jgi:hypothetical protein